MTTNYNKVKNDGLDDFGEKFGSATDYIYHEKTGSILTDSINAFLSTLAEKIHKATLEDNAQELRNILNRCKTERGLGVAMANYIKTLTKQL